MDDKQLAGIRAAGYVASGMVVGLGTGSTANHFLHELGRRVREERLEVRVVASSFPTAFLARELGLSLLAIEQVARLDLYADGADEVTPARDLLKGRGFDSKAVRQILRIRKQDHAERQEQEALVETYMKRLTWPCEIVELEAKKGISGAELMTAEADLIEKALNTKGHAKRVIMALDERGQNLPSRDFAKRIAALGNQGYSELTFIIGGADGLAPAIRDRAGLLLSFGAMTWPHMMVRVLLMEQIYRAQTIIAGHPYHRD